MFVFAEETGADRRNSLRKYGFSIRGKPAINKTLRVSAIACMSVNGVFHVKTLKGTSNGVSFYEFVQTRLLAHLMPFNGTNPHSVAVLDNCSIHNCNEVLTTLRDIGILVHRLQPHQGSILKS